MRTPNQTLADLLLGEPVEQWAGRRRAERVSWRRIALELRDTTERKVDVDPQTLANWCEDTAAEDTAAEEAEPAPAEASS